MKQKGKELRMRKTLLELELQKRTHMETRLTAKEGMKRKIEMDVFGLKVKKVAEKEREQEFVTENVRLATNHAVAVENVVERLEAGRGTV